ncbi:MAG: DUF3489 domain-containing protein [Pseudomonadota bacterium]
MRPVTPGSTQYRARDWPLPAEWRSKMAKSNLATQGSKRTGRVANKPTRREQLHKMLTRKSGVTIAQLQKTFGWQPHSARAAISAQRKSGYVVDRMETDKGSIYRIAEKQATK